eukprot:GHVP01043698.1.p1 GENE.GHVP01043698.1~~GHVP01043698.1.p1  ORF type:complete len:189 (+),score=42.03 GHVP01043698.1:402-968(+)
MGCLVIWILGQPGSGKGTLGENIKEHYDARHISAGDVLRNTTDPEIQKLITKGDIAPAYKILQLLSEEEKKTKNSIVMHDGFPRTLEQYELVENHFDKKADLTVWLTADEDTIIDRIHGRSLKDGNSRNDSDPEIVKHRLNVYKSQTEPLLYSLRNDNINLVEINTENMTPEEVFGIVDLKIKELYNK